MLIMLVLLVFMRIGLVYSLLYAACGGGADCYIDFILKRHSAQRSPLCTQVMHTGIYGVLLV
jgi:hypothetical protein